MKNLARRGSASTQYRHCEKSPVNGIAIITYADRMGQNKRPAGQLLPTFSFGNAIHHPNMSDGDAL